MDLVGSLLTFTMFWRLSSSMQCFVCDSCPTNFNYTVRQKYLKHCKHSTMCFKKVSTLDFGNGITSQNTQRGCAPQIADGEQVKIKGHWVDVDKPHEVYNEACSSSPVPDGERRTATLDCYCRGDECNSADVSRSAIGLIMIGVSVIAISWTTLNL